MTYILYTVFILSCLTLIASVLLQPGKADAGALFTSNISSNAFGPRGTQTILSKITIGAAILFMLSALLISVVTGAAERSVFETVESPAAATPAANANTNSNASAIVVPNEAVESNSASNANANVK